MTKYFFNNEDEERCYPKSHFIEHMKDYGLTEMKVTTAVMDTGSGHFYCTEFDFVGTKDDKDCGRQCPEYSPRNGKGGRCRFSKSCYVPGEDVVFKLKQ